MGLTGVHGAPAESSKRTSMAKFELLETFITGHPVIDAEHRQIATAINDVSDAVDAGAYDQCAILLDDFLQICENHFKSEEALLAEIGYPGLKDHVIFHQELILQAKAVKVLCLDMSNPESIKRCFDEMVSLLIEDVVKGDLQFVSFMIEQNIVEPPMPFNPPSVPDTKD